MYSWYRPPARPEPSESSNQPLDEARIEQAVQVAMVKTTVVSGLCWHCCSIIQITPTSCESRERAYQVLFDDRTFYGIRFHNSLGLEAASRAGCRMCSYIMNAMVANGELRALRSLEQSLHLTQQRQWDLGSVGQYYPSSTHTQHMTVDISMGKRTNVIVKIHYPSMKMEGIRPNLLFSLDVWGQSKNRKPCSKSIVSLWSLMKCRSTSGE
jgi:hypothetical protein